MVNEDAYNELRTLREEYRTKMNRSADDAAAAVQEGDMKEASIHSTESERYREAFHALNRAFKIIDAHSA